MSQLLDENDELLASPAREMTLGTASILGIFFGLALLCALFFGFGYNVGHKSASTALLSSAGEFPNSSAPTGTSSAETFNSFKPAAPKASPAAPAPAADSSDDSPSASPATSHASTAAAPAKSTTALHADTPARPVPVSDLTSHPSAGAPPPPSTSPALAGGPGVFFVQVAAVSHPEDASLLMGALRTKGYAVTQRSEIADKLIHIQVGPFPSKSSAEAMRQRLQGDGYNAIIK